ncbi:MAG: hypothetical protein HOK71_12645 [Planctomycetaceae bacterium]|jgi:hypothetical protein|nr:hypothetical protein [Planctomycetaceae bacterium]MBT6485493.1 hypothetical protein [Planctomycetaceae bacterium]
MHAVDAQPKHSLIYARVLSHCPQYVSGDRWEQFQDVNAFRGPSAPDATWAALQSEFSTDALQKSGVAVLDEAVLDEEGALALNPVLTDPEAVVIALRNTDDDPPFELLTSGGCLSGSALPVMAVLEDGPTSRWSSDFDNVLCVTFAISDVVALRALGIPATLATGLSELGHGRLEEFARRFQLRDAPSSVRFSEGPGNADRLDSHAAEEEIEPETGTGMAAIMPQLIFVDWSPATLTLERPEGLTAVRAHFARLEHDLGLCLEEVYTWQPTAAELQKLSFRLEYGNIKDVQSAVLQSLDESTERLNVPAGSMSQVFGPVADHATTVSQLHEIRLRRGDKQLRNKAWQNFGESLERDFIQPLICEAQGAAEPVQGNLLLALAETSRLHHMEAALIAENLARRVDEAGTQRIEGIPLSEMRKLLALTNQIVNLAKESKRCPKPSKVTIDATPNPMNPYRGSPDSD